jgi:hypothetical protein
MNLARLVKVKVVATSTCSENFQRSLLFYFLAQNVVRSTSHQSWSRTPWLWVKLIKRRRIKPANLQSTLDARVVTSPTLLLYLLICSFSLLESRIQAYEIGDLILVYLHKSKMSGTWTIGPQKNLEPRDYQGRWVVLPASSTEWTKWSDGGNDSRCSMCTLNTHMHRPSQLLHLCYLRHEIRDLIMQNALTGVVSWAIQKLSTLEIFTQARRKLYYFRSKRRYGNDISKNHILFYSGKISSSDFVQLTSSRYVASLPSNSHTCELAGQYWERMLGTTKIWRGYEDGKRRECQTWDEQHVDLIGLDYFSWPALLTLCQELVAYKLERLWAKPTLRRKDQGESSTLMVLGPFSCLSIWITISYFRFLYV